MRSKKVEAHAPWQENAPPYSSGWHLAFFLGKDSFIDTFVKPRPMPGNSFFALHFPGPTSPPGLLWSQPLQSVQHTLHNAFISRPSSRTCSGCLWPRVKLHPSVRRPGPHLITPLRLATPTPSAPLASSLSGRNSSLLFSQRGFPAMISQEEVLHQHRSLWLQLHPELFVVM